MQILHSILVYTWLSSHYKEMRILLSLLWPWQLSTLVFAGAASGTRMYNNCNATRYLSLQCIKRRQRMVLILSYLHQLHKYAYTC